MNKPLWYINEETLVAILQVIKDLNKDIKKEIITIIALEKDKEDYYKYEINCNHNIMNNSSISLADYYL